MDRFYGGEGDSYSDFQKDGEVKNKTESGEGARQRALPFCRHFFVLDMFADLRIL